MEERKPSRMNKFLAERQQWTSIQQDGRKEMLKDEQAST